MADQREWLDVKHPTVEGTASIHRSALEDYESRGWYLADKEPAPANYSRMKHAELVAEIERRNAARPSDAQLSTDGRNADLIHLLESDDTAGEQQGELLPE